MERVNEGGAVRPGCVGGAGGVDGAAGDRRGADGGVEVGDDRPGIAGADGDGPDSEGIDERVSGARFVAGPGEGPGTVRKNGLGGGVIGAGAGIGAGAATGRAEGAGSPDRVGDRGTRIEEVGVDGVGVGAGSVPVTLRIPADRDFVVLVRSAAGHLGARAGFSMAEMQDWRLAVDEACGLLLLPDEVDATGEELECVFRLEAAGVGVTVSAEARPGSKPQVGGFGWSLLAALVDGLNWAEEDGRVRVDIVKRAAGADGGRRAEAR